MYSLIIVDDEDITRTAISGYIQKKYAQLQVNGLFSNGADAVAYLKQHPVNIVITDIRMPRMDGLKLTKYIHEDYPGTIIIILSGYSEFEYAREALNYGVSNYLLKPLDFQELSQFLTKIIKKLDGLRTETKLETEDIQLFFTDLIGGLILDKKEFDARYERLSLPGSSSDYKGCLMTITLHNDTLARWNYGQETLSTALQNCIHMLIPQYETYYLFRSGLRFYFILLSLQGIPTVSAEELTNAIFHLLHFNCSIQTPSTYDKLESLIPAAVSQNASTSVLTELPSSNDDIIIQKALEYISEHYAEDISREDVANAVYLSSAYFSRLFKMKTGMTFIDYLTTARMQKAMEFLKTRMKVADIAQKVGYQSRNRFFINFQQCTGYSPTEYRRQILKMEDFHEE